MNIYSKTTPNLIDNSILNEINQTFKIVHKHHTWNDGLNYMYINYIRPNLFAIIAILILAIFLFIRYYLKKNRKKQKRNNYKIDYGNNLMDNQDTPIEFYENKQINEIPEVENDLNLYRLEDEYRAISQNNNNYVSDTMLKDFYENKTSRMSFDELANVIGGNQQ